jgi:hypothetical protein
MVRDSIRKDYSFSELLTCLDVVSPLNNIIRKECWRHCTQLQLGRLGKWVRKKVQYCVADEFNLEFPAPGGMYMGHRDSYAASALCQYRTKVQ